MPTTRLRAKPIEVSRRWAVTPSGMPTREDQAGERKAESPVELGSQFAGLLPRSPARAPLLFLRARPRAAASCSRSGRAITQAEHARCDAFELFVEAAQVTVLSNARLDRSLNALHVSRAAFRDPGVSVAHDDHGSCNSRSRPFSSLFSVTLTLRAESSRWERFSPSMIIWKSLRSSSFPLPPT